MAEKDMTEKTLVSFNDVFADILNGLLFDGRDVVHPEELEQSTTVSVYKADGKLREQERDEAKYWRGEGGIRIALFGVENQTQPEQDIPFRVIGYDGAAYWAQIYAEKGEDGKYRPNRNPRYGVVTLVLYFGYKQRWNTARTLHENIDVMPNRLLPFVSNYKINLYEIAWLTDAQAACFKSDFRFVVDYFIQMRKNGDYIPSTEEITHVREVLQLMNVLTGDHRFDEAFHNVNAQETGEVNNMSEVLDRIEQRGEQRGKQEGIKEGIRALIDVCREDFALDDRSIISKVAARFHLTEEQSAQYVLQTYATGNQAETKTASPAVSG